MYELEIRGIPVSFPFEAYDNQKLYMQRVMDALQKVSSKNPHAIPVATCLTVANWISESFAAHSCSSLQEN